jgi:hypothetical protein
MSTTQAETGAGHLSSQSIGPCARTSSEDRSTTCHPSWVVQERTGRESRAWTISHREQFSLRPITVVMAIVSTFLFWPLTRKHEHLGLGANLLESTSSTAQILFKTPNFAECLAFLPASQTTPITLGGSDPARFREIYLSVSTVMSFAGLEEGSGIDTSPFYWPRVRSAPLRVTVCRERSPGE